MFAGFYDKEFFIYNETKAHFLFTADCGGGHRIWDFRLNKTYLEGAVFGFIKLNQLVLAFANSLSVQFQNPILKESYHGLETRSIIITDFPDGIHKLVISGGEDGILTFHKCNSQLKCRFAAASYFKAPRCKPKTQCIYKMFALT